MDLNSLNSGPISEKGWLNPICNAVKAKTVESEESVTRSSETGLAYPNTATTYVWYTPSPLTNTISIPGIFLTAGRSQSSVPASAFVAGTMFEYFYAGKFVDTTPADTSFLQLALTFTEGAIPTTAGELFCDANITSGQATNTEQMFQVRGNFHITASGPTSITIEQTMLMLCNGTANVNGVNSSETKVVTTPSRVLNSSFSPRPFALSAGGPVTLTTYNWYLRRTA